MAGAVLLVSALVLEKGRILRAQSLTVVGENPVLRLGLLRQRQDARKPREVPEHHPEP